MCHFIYNPSSAMCVAYIFLDVCLPFDHSYSLVRECTLKEKWMTLLPGAISCQCSTARGRLCTHLPVSVGIFVWLKFAQSLCMLLQLWVHVCSCPAMSLSLCAISGSFKTIPCMYLITCSLFSSCLPPSWRRPLSPVYPRAYLVLGTQHINNEYLI